MPRLPIRLLVVALLFGGVLIWRVAEYGPADENLKAIAPAAAVIALLLLAFAALGLLRR